MTAAELKSFKERSLAKHEEIRQAIKGLEEEFISSNSPYRIGDNQERKLLTSSVMFRE